MDSKREKLKSYITEEIDKTVETMALFANPVELVNNMYGCRPAGRADKTVERIALFENPVELVNNIYGCHSGRDGSDYFSRVYSNF